MIIYTTITKDDCPLPIQTIKTNYECVCFHSVDIKEKQTFWNYQKIRLIEENPLLTQRSYKLLSHKYIQEDSCYFDPKNLIINIPTPTKDFLINRHPFKKNMLDELKDWYLLPAITMLQGKEILQYFNRKKYDFSLNHIGMIGNVIYRKYTRKNIKHNNIWFSIFKKFKIRDQLPFYLSSFLSKLDIEYSDKVYAITPEHQPYTWNNKDLYLNNLTHLTEFIKLLKQYNSTYTLNQDLLDFRLK